MMWNQIKYHNLRFNVYISQSLKLVDLIWKICENISAQLWINYTNNNAKEEETFRILDHVIDNEIEPFIIHLSESDDSCDSSGALRIL